MGEPALELNHPLLRGYVQWEPLSQQEKRGLNKYT